MSWPVSSESELLQSGVEEGQLQHPFLCPLSPGYILGLFLKSPAQPSSCHSCRSCPWKRR